ncbi:unnamed protein product [Rhizophagus irregularis]|nr:unnamed protein product [Rhizophagus irregularis]
MKLLRFFKPKKLVGQKGELYNQFYYTSYHKKNPLSQQKLFQLSSSLELSVNQPWACNDLWNQVMPSVFSLIEILRKYSEYLVTTTASMIEFHHSDKNARNPKNSSTMYRIAACDNLHDNYVQLNDVLLDKPLYNCINIQPYLPFDVMKRYRYIKELQLMFSIGVYRYHQGNYLGTINFI